MSNSHQDLMKSIIKSVQDLLNIDDIKMESDFHISISKVFQIKLKTYEPLCQDLDEKFKSINKLYFNYLVVNKLKYLIWILI